MRRDEERLPARGSQGGLTRWGGSPLRDWGDDLFSVSPWQMMRRMQEDMDRIFSGFFGGGGGAGTAIQPALQQWAPTVDVSQTEKEWCIEADLPGVKRENIDVEVRDGHLYLHAEMQEEQGPEGGNGGQGGQRQYHRRERRWGVFERIVPLPAEVDEEQIRCEFRDGVLTVHLPRSEQAAPPSRRIPVTAGESQGAGAAGGRAQATAAQRGPGGTPEPHHEEEEETAMAGAKGGETTTQPEKGRKR